MSTGNSAPGQAIDLNRPWLGLSSFSEQTASLFFGRDGEIRALQEHIHSQPLTVLYGLSGRGKSSLLGAGVIPQLRAGGARPVLLRLQHDGTSLIQQLRAAWDTAVGCTASDRCLWERAYSRADRPNLRAHPPVLILDQFEEIFTLGQKPEQKQDLDAFFQELAGVVENRVPMELRERLTEDEAFAEQFVEQTTPARVVITLREDFLAQLEQWKGQLPALMRNRMGLRPLNGVQATQAVLRPGRLGDHELVDDATAAEIVRFVAQAPADTPMTEIEAVPPLLSLLCYELNEARLSSGAARITTEHLREQGSNILQNFYLRCFEGQPEAVREVVESPLIVSESGHRNACTHADLLLALKEAGLTAQEAEAALQRLVEVRLLTQEFQGGARRLELTHDILTPLVVRSRNEQRARRQLAAAEAEQAATLLRNQELERSKQQMQGLAAAASALALVAVLAGDFAWHEARQARLHLEEATRQKEKAETEKSRADTLAASEKAARAEVDRQFMALQTSNQALEAAQRTSSHALSLARRNIDDVLTVLESPEMDQVHGFSPIEKRLMDKLVPLSRELESQAGADTSAAGLLRQAQLELRTAKQFRDKGDQLAAAQVYQRLLRFLRQIPSRHKTGALLDAQLEAMYRLDHTRHLIPGYKRDEVMAEALATVRNSPPSEPGGRYWRESIVQQVADWLEDAGRVPEALELLSQARKRLSARLATHPDDFFALQTAAILANSSAGLKDRNGDAAGAAEDREESSRLEKAGRNRWPESVFFARSQLYTLFEQLDKAYNRKDESEHQRLQQEISAITDRFKDADGANAFKAAAAKLLQQRANFARWVKKDEKTALDLSLKSLQAYGALYAGRPMELTDFDESANSLTGIVQAHELIQQRADDTARAALKVQHARQLIELSEPFLPCAKATSGTPQCGELVQAATHQAAEYLQKGISTFKDSVWLEKVLAERRALLDAGAMSMLQADQKLPKTTGHEKRPSTEPLMKYCKVETVFGSTLLNNKKAPEALSVLNTAANRCEAWSRQYDWDFYLLTTTGELFKTLAQAQRDADQGHQARNTLARCWEMGMFACQKPYAEMLSQGQGGPKDEEQASKVLAYKPNMKRFTVRVRAKGVAEGGLTVSVQPAHLPPSFRHRHPVMIPFTGAAHGSPQQARHLEPTHPRLA